MSPAEGHVAGAHKVIVGDVGQAGRVGRVDTQFFEHLQAQGLAGGVIVMENPGAALRYRLVEESHCGRHRKEGVNLSAAAGLSGYCDVIGISAEGLNVVPDPLQGQYKVLHSYVHAVLISFSKASQVKVSQDVEPVVEAYHHNVSFPGQGTAFIALQFRCRAGCESASVYPEEHGTLLAVVQALGPDVEHQAVGLVHWLYEAVEAKVAVRGAGPPVEADAGLGALGAECAAYLHAVVRGGFLRRHEPFRNSVLDAFEGVHVAVKISLDKSGLGAGYCSFIAYY